MDGNRIFRRFDPEEEYYQPVTMRGEANPGELIPLQQLIAPNVRPILVKQLFSEKEADFHSFVGVLQDVSNWKEASNVIEQEYIKRGIPMYSETARLFSSIIYRRYYPLDEYVSVGL
jgi:hypothetical protein